jgi:hypothetical protein
MAFSKWQEQTLMQAPSEVEPPLKEIMVSRAEQGVDTHNKSCRLGGGRLMTGQAPMITFCLFSQLTPASQNDLSDFRSEPALYF